MKPWAEVGGLTCSPKGWQGLISPAGGGMRGGMSKAWRYKIIELVFR